MSNFDKYRPFEVVVNAVNKLNVQGFTDLTGDKDKIAELITQELIQAGVLNEYLKTDRPYPTNIHNTLEELISDGGHQVFIHKLNFDINQDLLTLDLQFNPESDDIDKTLIFHGVQDFEDVLDIDEYDANCLDAIIGLDQYSTKYVLKTHEREISFSSMIAPEILLLRKGTTN
jgi:hypothetical protein